MKVLVTGSEGFIGKSLIKKFNTETCHNIHCFDRNSYNTSDPNFWDFLPRFDCVIHLAGKTNVLESWQKPTKTLLDNITSTIHVVEYCRRNKSKLIYPSSFLYRAGRPGPFKESDDLKPYNPYACTKLFGENIIQTYFMAGLLDARIIRLFNVYGPDQKSGFLIPDIIAQLSDSNAIELNDLRPIRDFVHVEDVVEIINRLIDYEGKQLVFNVGTGLGYSVKQIVNLMIKITGRKVTVIDKKLHREIEILSAVADITLLKSELGFSPQINIFDGLSRILNKSNEVK